MTNGELQKKLAEFPDDMNVVSLSSGEDGWSYDDIEVVKIKKDDMTTLVLAQEWLVALV